MKKTFLLSVSALLASVFLFLTSCSSEIMGYSVVLWNIQDENKGEKIAVADGTIVPVYLKSHINNVYVIGIPGSKTKIEIPLWKISKPESKKKASVNAKKYRNTLENIFV